MSTQTITVTVTDVEHGEKPGKPDAPAVTTVSVSEGDGELERRRTNAGPAITDYDYQPPRR